MRWGAILFLRHSAKRAISSLVRVARYATPEKHKNSEGLIGTEDLAAAGYSIRKAARALGCSFGHLARHLKGERPSVRMQGRLKNLLKDTTP
jgi:hypothetical protein